MKRAVGYLRQSKRKLDSISFSIQEEAIRDHCRRNNLELVAVHGDEGVSGLKGVDQRPGMRAAMDDLRAGKAEVVVVWRFSRISRNRLHQAMILQELKDLKAGIQAAMEPIDTSTSAGAFSMDVLMSLAQMESSQRSEGWKEAHDLRLSRGLHPHQRRVFGYTPDREKGYIPNEEADLVREAYRLYISGAGFPSIAQWLHERGTVQPMGGKVWNKVSVSRMLDNPIYRGQIRFRGQVHPGRHEALISEETWQAYQKARIGRSSVAPRHKGASAYWLAGIVRCGNCGASMSRNRGSSGKEYLMCHRHRAGAADCGGNTIRQDVVDTTVAFWLYSHMDQLAGQLPTEEEALASLRQEVTAAEEALEKAKGERARLQLLAVRLGWSDEEVSEAMAEVAHVVQDAQKRLDDARAQVGGYVAPVDDVELLRQGIELLGEGDQSEEAFRQAVKRAVGKVVVAPRTEGLAESERVAIQTA